MPWIFLAIFVAWVLVVAVVFTILVKTGKLKLNKGPSSTGISGGGSGTENW